MLHVAGPAIPYEGYFQGAVEPGFSLVVVGQAYLGSSRFSINLCCGKTIPGYPQPEIALHLNARFDQQCLARNSLLANLWGDEERSNGFPLFAGTTFQIKITAEAHQFNILVNGNHFTTFKYRIPINRITTLRIHGEIIVKQATATGISTNSLFTVQPAPFSAIPFKAMWPDVGGAPTVVQPPPYSAHGMPEDILSWPSVVSSIKPTSPSMALYTPPTYEPPPYTPPLYVPTATLVPLPNAVQYSPFPETCAAHSVPGLPYFMNSPPVPVAIHIPGKLRPGLTFAISGTSWPTSQNFRIDFKLPNNDIALHISCRFSCMTVVRNSRRRGRWEREERGGNFPLCRGAPFHMLITCHRNFYEIKFNSILFAIFQHRIFPVEEVALLEINGELKVHMVNITAS